MASLAELEVRVSALESTQSSEGEVLQPNYLTIDPTTGVITPRFPSLILPAATSLSSGGPANSIVWQRQSDGAQVAQIWAGNVGPAELLNLTATAITPTDNSTVALAAVDDQGTSQMEIDVTQNSRGQGVIYYKQPPGTQKAAWTAAGQSIFVQNSSPTVAAVFHGDPMLVYTTAQSAAVGVNANFNYIAGVGVAINTGTDPGGRWNGTAYVCRNTGVYLAFGAINWPTGAANNGLVGAQNVRTAYMVATEFLSTAATATAGASFTSLIPCNAGDTIVPVARFSASLSVGGVLAGTPGTWFGAMQVM